MKAKITKREAAIRNLEKAVIDYLDWGKVGCYSGSDRYMFDQRFKAALRKLKATNGHKVQA